jgi:general secretion pathway protein M
MRDWLAGLEMRERAILLGGLVLGIVIIGWGLIWAPLNSGTLDLSDSVAAKQRMLATLQRARSLSASDAASTDGSARRSLVLLVDQTHRNYGLEGSLIRNQPDGEDGIRVTFQDAAFDGLIAWLGTLRTSYAVGVESATVDGTGGIGIVNATLVLRRP